MAEPATTSAAVVAATTAAGLTLFGVATGLHPANLLAGLAGGLWALSYQEPSPPIKRLAVTVMSAVVAGYLTPAIAAGVTSLGAWPSTVSSEMVQPAMAVIVGLLSHTVIGPAILKIAQQKAQEVAK